MCTSPKSPEHRIVRYRQRLFSLFVDAGVCRHNIEKDSSVNFCVCVHVIGFYVYHALWVRVVMTFEL